MKYSGYDIYGEPLLIGHCEVHPWMAIEYPCPQCFADDERRRNHEKAEREYWEKIEREYWEEVEREYIESLQCMNGGGI
jgi:hypothetical protein